MQLSVKLSAPLFSMESHSNEAQNGFVSLNHHTYLQRVILVASTTLSKMIFESANIESCWFENSRALQGQSM